MSKLPDTPGFAAAMLALTAASDDLFKTGVHPREVLSAHAFHCGAAIATAPDELKAELRQLVLDLLDDAARESEGFKARLAGGSRA